MWHIVIPRMLTAGATGMFPADLVSKFPPVAGKELFSKSSNVIKDLGRLPGREIELETRGGTQWIRYRNEVLVRAYQVREYEANGENERKKVRLNIHPISLLLDRKDPLCNCSWAPHLNNIAIVRRTSSDS